MRLLARFVDTGPFPCDAAVAAGSEVELRFDVLFLRSQRRPLIRQPPPRPRPGTMSEERGVRPEVLGWALSARCQFQDRPANSALLATPTWDEQ